MEFLVNELSFHGQFSNATHLRLAIRELFTMRALVRRFGHKLYCHRSLPEAIVMEGKTLRQALLLLDINERRALMQWFTQHGPFWEDLRQHGDDDWLEWNGQIVTNTALGEAAWCAAHRIQRDLVSLAPSEWMFSPILVDWIRDQTSSSPPIAIENHWNSAATTALLGQRPLAPDSWEMLGEQARRRYERLTFSTDAFQHLHGYPFAPGASQRIAFILDILDRLKSCFNSNGERTAEGHRLYQDFFTGKKGDGGRGALFSDSSDDEKHTLRQALTFPHPTEHGQMLFCPWHGKVQTPPVRVHFSWPISAGQPLYVVYVGPKLTKR